MCTGKNKNDLPWITILSTGIFFFHSRIYPGLFREKNGDNSHHKCVFNLPSDLQNSLSILVYT